MKRLRDFGYAVLLGSYLLLMSLFMLAYFNQDKILGLRINTYGEANLEFIMFLVSIPAVFYYLRENRK